MTVHQQAYEVGAFAEYLRDLVARLDPGRGWYGIFARRDPAGMRSCLDGVEIPPWDVVESLLADLAALHGARFAEQVSVRAAALYSASAAAHDRRPGGRQELVHRLELMVREQHRAAERLRGSGPGGPDPAEPDALAWARDDHERASARCAELRKRLAAVAAPEGWLRSEDGEGQRAGVDGASVSGSAGAGRVPRPRAGAGGAMGGRPHGRGTGAEGEPAWADDPARDGPAETFAPEPPRGWGPEASEARARLAAGPYAGTEPSGPAEPSWATEPHGAPESPRHPDASTPTPRRKKPRGARFAGLEVDDEEAAGYAPSPLPGPPVPDRSGAPAPRGARFGGAAAEAEGHGGRGGQGGHAGRGRGRAGRDRPGDGAADPVAPDPAAGQAVTGAVAQLVRLRAEGRSGEAHVVLCEVAAWPAPRLPLLALALHRAGLAADWTTLLWEVSSLPPAGFAAAAGALAAAGREADCGLLLRQGVARPAAEVADAALALDGAGRDDRARDLLGAFVRVRTPQEAAELALSGGTRLLPLLLGAAREVSGEAEWDLVHALRVAGVPGV
ncbi:hypothetical protein WQO_29125 [Streptomyces globisporus C-1027]|uniref:UL36 very large tegument protein n=1 Tax=Streptomyces globisporus C-1027 TaxID=1172567 RepID=A0A0U2T5V9_STRGL|nr:hypothetical protein [Streptomyces globisporus]ALU97040.1 hypothetical protein WQO_29125 [Streptomyces globisporus C-1027]